MIKLIKYLFIFTLILLTVLSVVYFKADKIFPAYASLFTINNPSKGADAILVLAGSPLTRPAKAIDLYRQGFADTICITQISKPASKYHSILKEETDIVLEILALEKLIALQIPSNKGGATSTFDEARDMARYIKEHGGLNHLIIVTDSFHTARSYYAFTKIFKQMGIDTKIQMAAAPNQLFNEHNWWKTEAGLISYVLEPLKFLFYITHDKNVDFVKES